MWPDPAWLLSSQEVEVRVQNGHAQRKPPWEDKFREGRKTGVTHVQAEGTRNHEEARKGPPTVSADTDFRLQASRAERQ